MSDSVESSNSSSATNVLNLKTQPPQNNGGEPSAPPSPTAGGGSQAPTGVVPPPARNSASAAANDSSTSPPPPSPPPPQSPEPTKSPPPAAQPPPASPPPPTSSPPPSPPTSPPPSPNPPKTSEPPPSPTPSVPTPSSPPPSSPPPKPSQQSRPTPPSKSDPPPTPDNPSTPKPASVSNGSAVSPPLQPSPLTPVVFTPPSPSPSTSPSTLTSTSTSPSPDRSPNAPPVPPLVPPLVPPRSITPPSNDGGGDAGGDAGGSSTAQSSPPAPEGKSSKTPTPSNGKGEHGNASVASKATLPIVGAILGGALILLIVAIVLFARSRKKRKGAYPPKYMPPANFPVKQDGFYYGPQPQSMGSSGGSQPPYSFGESNASSGGNGHNGAPDSNAITGGKIHFSYEDLMEMTNAFSQQNIIGEGGFGCVYKGCMSDGKVVAVKQLKVGSGQGEREFRAEVEIISRVHHRYLVSLVGYCISNSQRLLIYEFVPNKTLEHHLHAKDLPVLDWPKRLKIAIGSAKGLAYLHEDCHPKIIHRDIKSANILLDDDFEAQVADFGLARLNDTAQTHVSTRVMGTFGYLAPEYASSGKLTDRSDVYSFGVVLLELITGRKPIDQSQPLGDESLVEWARPLLLEALETGDLSLVVDPRLGKHYVEGEMIRMIETAAACVRHSGPKRPRMAQVVRALDSDDMGDLTNGTKYGQSVVYSSGQYSEEIMRFKRMALSESGDLTRYSGEYNSPEMSRGYTSSESETRAMNRPNRQPV